MKRINKEELKQIQLNITQEFHNFCVKNNIHYSLGYGSLLGAVRHNGYIPWDDDMDIIMMRDDYKRFQKLFPKKYKGYLNFVSLETDNAWQRPFGKLCDTRTVLIESSSDSYHLGVNVDVFPIDAVPDDEKVWHRYNAKRLIIWNIYTIKIVKLIKSRSLYKNVLLLLLKSLVLPIPIKLIAQQLNKYAQKYNELSSKFAFDNLTGEKDMRPLVSLNLCEICL